MQLRAISIMPHAARVAIHIRDFDHAVIGNPTDDLIRLGLSLAMAGQGVRSFRRRDSGNDGTDDRGVRRGA